MSAPRSAFNRRDFLRYSGIMSAAAALSTTISACGGPASTGSAGSGGDKDLVTVVIGYGNDQSWDPTMSASAFAMAGNNHIYEGLVDTDPITRAPYPALATALPADPSATTWKFTLRPGAKWHDGQPVTVDDVLFTFDRVQDGSTLVSSFFTTWLKEVRKVDETSVELVFTFSFPDALQRLTIAKIMPKHVFGQPGGWDAAKNGKAVGSGPYKMTAHHPKSNTTFEAFADYNGPRKPAIKKMNWLSIVDASARVAKISGGGAEAQIADNVPYANIDQLRKQGLTVEGGKGMNHMFLMFNTAQKPFDDVRVRQALLYAIDTKKMIDVALKGHGTPASSFLNKENPAYAPAKTVYDYNPDKAKSLLAAAGVKNLSINLMAVNVSWIADCLPTIANSWNAIGVKTSLEPQDTSALFTKMDQSQNYQVVAAASNPNQFGLDADLILRYNYTSGGTWMKYTKWDKSSDAKSLFALMDRATREPDKTKKLELLHQYLDVIAEQAVLYPVLHTELMTAWNPKKLTGVRAQAYPGVNLLQAKRV
ncbi:ABC transporter substrate-binding protein [Actinoallomurus rhizosphaericola]|uniref:ABC transporter substrate-binding protein n=1 Tax=Actinoallomurus rhizosphaericola TaxID=2952536 RepID=UPI002092AAF8|nr:ABC transporter substrate-binding protein [Actinoallomurus rhizosphaericola]MCO5997317.1 ABC transporter substrate-binding protein [Actinoallomurus rhizosphaericola]